MQQAPPESHSIHNLIQENSRALAFAWHFNTAAEVKLDFHKFLRVLHENLVERLFLICPGSTLFMMNLPLWSSSCKWQCRKTRGSYAREARSKTRPVSFLLARGRSTPGWKGITLYKELLNKLFGNAVLLWMGNQDTQHSSSPFMSFKEWSAVYPLPVPALGERYVRNVIEVAHT